jgi:uncharacterized cupredoxin-like copper-binding protein
VTLAALLTRNELILALVAAAFIVFALVSSFVLPRRNVDFPGRRLRWFILLCVAFFVVMIGSVILFGEEEEHAEAAAGEVETGEMTEPVETSGGEAVRTVEVTLVDFDVRLPAGMTLSGGKYEFAVTNDGQVPHNLVIKGPEVEDVGTPIFDPGKTAELTVNLPGGEYQFYCSVPGHLEAGMTTDVQVDPQ